MPDLTPISQPTEATLQHSCARLLAWEDVSLFGSHGFEGTDIRNVKVRPSADQDEVRAAFHQIDRWCKPCPPEIAAKALAELRALTVHKARDSVDVEGMAAAYTQRLAQYPADIVVDACNAWADREEFWPSWAELKAECDKRNRVRKAFRDALERAIR